MTLTQLSYIVAVDKYRHFATAAQHIYITQPTLSMQIQKLEDQMYKYANDMEFERAAFCRDKIKDLKFKLIES